MAHSKNETPQERYRRKHPGRVKTQRRARYAREKEQQAAKKAAMRAENPEKYRAEVWRAKGLPLPTRGRPPLCECCGQPPSHGHSVLCLDHDHATGEFRGWICSACNTGIGKLGDGLKGVLNAMAYLCRAKDL